MLSVLEGGLATAASHLAVDSAQLYELPVVTDSLRFYRMMPAVVVGRYQRTFHEVRLDYCQAQGIQVLRRFTGGGALYHDPNQLAFSLLFTSPLEPLDRDFSYWLERLTKGLVAGLTELGLPCQFSGTNDVEVEGRKLATCFITHQGQRWLFHGVVLMDVDIERLLTALRLPTEKLSPTGLAGARQRLITVRELVKDALNLTELQRGIASGLAAALGQSPGEWGVSPPLIPVTQDSPEDAWCVGAEALWKTPGGLLRAAFSFDPTGQYIQRAALGGDVVVDPPELFEQLEDWLTGIPVAQGEEKLAAYWLHRSVKLLRFTQDDLRQVIILALARLDQRVIFDLTGEQANRLMVLGGNAQQTLAQARVMLVPYCAKPTWCSWRHRDGCAECGRCDVGNAYHLARERGMKVISIGNYEHLRHTLGEMQATAIPGYVGMCCQQFFIKRQQAFQEVAIPAVLMDITGANCYELRQEEQAYAGTFMAEAQLDLPLLHKVMAHIPEYL